MTLTTTNDNQPDWVKANLGIEEYKEFKLGQKVKYQNDYVYIIHIQKQEGAVLFRGMLSNGASITMLYELINKPVTTTNEQPKIPLDLKMQLMEIMCKHIELRNSDKITDVSLYHAFLDWEKEVWKLLQVDSIV